MDWHYDVNSLYMSDTDYESEEDDILLEDLPDLVKDIQIYNGYGQIIFFDSQFTPNLTYINSLFL